MIPYGKQHITEEDIEAVVSTLKSDYLTQGPQINEFEIAFQKYIGAKYAVAVANGTAALHLSVLALGIQPGDKVITSPITFAASSNCIAYCGGEVVFADIDRSTYLLDINNVRKLLEAAPPGTYKGIVPVDFGGNTIDLEAFRQLADEYGLWILEDACHAPGGFFVDSNGQKQFCGNGLFAELAIFSFHPVKHIACGEGGMITTNDEKLYQKLLQLRTHGITRNNELFQNSVSLATGTDNGDAYPGWYMEMQMLGYNYRLTDFQAALGISQLKRANEGLARRREIAGKYDQAFKGKNGIKTQSNTSQNTEPNGHAYHLYIIEVNNRLELYHYLRENDIFAQVHYIPTHIMPYYLDKGWKVGDFPLAENYYRYCLSLPMYPTLSDKEQQFVINKVLEFIQ